MREWIGYTLGEIANVQTGPFGSQLHMKDYVSVGTPIITVEHLGDNRVTHENLPLVSEADKERLKKYSLRAGDIVFSRVGSVDRRAYVSQKEEGWLFSGRCLRVRVESSLVEPKFLSYYFGQESFKEHIRSIAVGATMPSINTEILSGVKIMIPDITTQRQISEVLSSLDDKIDVLNEQNLTLERLADTLYRTWITNPMVETGVSFKLKDYIDTANTGLDAIKRAPIVEQDTGTKCLRIQDVSQRKPYRKWGNTLVDPNNFAKFQLRKDDIIMARTCSPGINFFVREDMAAVFNNGLVRLRAKRDKVYPILLYYLFKTRDFIGHIDGISGGTSVQLNMQVGDLLDYDVAFPEKIRQDEIIQPFLDIDNKVHNNNSQIQVLEQLRDTLLAKLMSREVIVSHTEKKLSYA